SGGWVVGVDFAVSKIPDQQAVAEAAEVGRRHRQPPGSIQGASGNQATDQDPTGVEHVDNTQAGAVDFVRPTGGPLRERNVEPATDRLDTKWRIVCRQRSV